MGNIIIGILFIIGGASGEFVLRGTNSSGGLTIVGAILIVIGIIQMAKKGKEKPEDTIHGQEKVIPNEKIDRR